MRFALAVLVLLAAPALAQETGYAVRETEVKKAPYSDAQTAGTLAEKAQVKVLDRQNGWMQIESGTQSGWVRMLSIRMDSGSSGFVSGLKSLFSVARTGSSGRTVTTGVRGLDKEDIKNAKPNSDEVRKLAAFAASRSDAEKFAAGNPKLATQRIDYLQAAK